MIKQTFVLDGNEAVARVAYRVTEFSAIYPITPSTVMGELVEQWSTEEVKNLWGTIPQTVEMQSEAGAAGALHGALQMGSLATTFTASQGLLLMLPNMYKIAGELMPTVIHVAARSIACQGLSIFGDHSDVMGARETGFAMLASGSVEEAQDLALIAHAATLKTRIPFLHFFEGFRISHEINKITLLSEEEMRAMIDEELVVDLRKRGLNPQHPKIRGTAQNPDVYFQGRETVNPFYAALPLAVEEYMERFARLTGRVYQTFKYYGDPDAEQVIVIMGSGAKTVKQTVEVLNQKGVKVGVIQVYLYRPFYAERFLALLPKTVKVVTVLDRTKEPGSVGEPLYQDVVSVLVEAYAQDLQFHGRTMPRILGGRYGLSSKEFTPAMVKGIIENGQSRAAKNHFSVGIYDDLTSNSVGYDPTFQIKVAGQSSAIFYGLGSDGTVGANKNTLKIIGKATDLYVQGYFVYDSKKAGSKTISHLRFAKDPIESPYLLAEANFVGCHQFNFVDSSRLLDNAAEGATFLLNSPYGVDEIWEHLPRVIVEKILAKKLNFYLIDAYKVAANAKLGARINTIMQTCFFAISGILPREEAISAIKKTIEQTYRRKGEEIVRRNCLAVDSTLANLHQVPLISQVSVEAYELPACCKDSTETLEQKVVTMIMQEKGEAIPVSAMPVDGTFPTGTTRLEKRNLSSLVPQWNSELCLQCGQCTVVCPHGVLRAKLLASDELNKAPASFTTAPSKLKEFAHKQFRLQAYVEDCTGCGLCYEACPVVNKEDPKLKAINLVAKSPILEQEKKNISFFEQWPYLEKTEVAGVSGRDLQYLRPYFEFSSACAGCGETPYLKLISQLFGDRMLVANATGCSSIYGGNLPTVPWCKDQAGRGPAWANSLFEDNAEFGFGFRLSLDKQQVLAVEFLKNLQHETGEKLIAEIIDNLSNSSEQGVKEQRERLVILDKILEKTNHPKAKHLQAIMHNLLPTSVWAVGGDGWAYDIGYGGLDHVLSTESNLNVLVLDNAVYSNTGGQASKSTPRGAMAKFATAGKSVARKDLGMIAMSYGHIYVAQIALGANPIQAIKALKEAEAFSGPSLVLAYSHCITQGFDLRSGLNQQKLAVNCGFWPLYRYNPGCNANPLQIDSKAPSIPVEKFIYNEQRFKFLRTSYPERAAALLESLEKDVEFRWNRLQRYGLR